MYAYENSLGGRVVVQAYDLRSAYGVSFNHTFRAEQLHGIVRWLSRGAPAVQHLDQRGEGRVMQAEDIAGPAVHAVAGPQASDLGTNMPQPPSGISF